jgi:hypothetical protein
MKLMRLKTSPVIGRLLDSPRLLHDALICSARRQLCSYIPYKSSSRNLYTNLKSALRRFILERLAKVVTQILLGSLPSRFVVKEAIRALLKLFCDCLRLLVPLKPRLILLVEPPTLVLQSTCG